MIQPNEILFTAAEYYGRLLGQGDLELINNFNEKCLDFFMLQNGMPPTQADALELLDAVPQDRKVDDKLPIGIFDSREGELVGVIDVLRNYRIGGDWWIGLILLAPVST
jgi:hypothetical protein